MSRFKDFGADETPENVEPLVFKLHGETFNCVKEIQGATILHLAESTSGDESDSASAAVILDFFDKALEDESLERFTALINSKDKIVRIDKLGEIMGWLIEEYTNRPEEQPEA